MKMKHFYSKVCLKLQSIQNICQNMQILITLMQTKKLQLSPAAFRVGSACKAHISNQGQFNRVNFYL